MIQNKKTQKKQLNFLYPEDLPTIYCNYATFMFAAFDLSIDVGTRSDMGGNPNVKISARMIMSPQHAKVFATKMKELIDNYEKDFGTISTQPTKKHEKE